MIKALTPLVPMLLFTAALAGCSLRDDHSTPESAFAALSRCVNNSDASCLFSHLDQDSRWSTATLHKTLLKMQSIVEKSYPVEARTNAYGAFSGLMKAQTPQECFALFCAERNCLGPLQHGYAAVTGRQQQQEQIVLETARGGRFSMAQAQGRFGLASFAAELTAAKLRALDKLPEIERNAMAYEEQRLASGQP